MRNVFTAGELRGCRPARAARAWLGWAWLATACSGGGDAASGAGTGGVAGLSAGDGGTGGATTDRAGASGGGAGKSSSAQPTARPTLDTRCPEVGPWEASFAPWLCDDGIQCEGSQLCVKTWTASTGCSGVNPGPPIGPPPCATDSDCSPGFECVDVPAAPGVGACVEIPCDRGEPCPLGYRCDAPTTPGRGCVWQRCDEPDAPACPGLRCQLDDEPSLVCPQECGPDVATCTTAECRGAYTHAPMINCRYVHCSASGAGCPRNFDCDPTALGSGCVRRRCTASTECDCGVCLYGVCSDRAGVCQAPLVPCNAP